MESLMDASDLNDCMILIVRFDWVFLLIICALVNFSLFVKHFSKMYPVSFPCGLLHDK